jgi:hypothetical protein
MNIPKITIKGFTSQMVLLALFVGIINTLQPVTAQNLESTNYKIQDASISNGGDLLDSTTYSLIGNLGDIANDARITSGTYEIKSGSEQDLVSVPLISCFEANSTSDNTECLKLPNQKGMIGECGGFGCYSKAKIEINTQGNPYDTLYAVQIINNTDNITYYLKSDHTLSLTQTISNYLTKCAIEGIDVANPNCDLVGDSGWNSNLQSTNIYNLDPQKNYSARVKALNGDYTETIYSETKSTITTSQSLSLDMDIGPEDNPIIENTSPYTINVLSGNGYQSVQTGTNLIWFDFNSNNMKGFDFYIKSKNQGLYSATRDALIPSDDEDLATENNEGYGIKIFESDNTQQSLGPLIKSSIYDTSGANVVGAVTNANRLLFSTRDIGNDRGELLNGRSGIILKAKTRITTPIAGDYTDELSFTIIGVF